jgi:hypothetical protein
MRKFDDKKSSSMKRDRALEKFREAEEPCLNAPAEFHRVRFSDLIHTSMGGIRPDAVMHTARGKIEKLLGEFRWADALQDCGFGPGATTTLPRTKADLFFKFLDVPEASTPCSRLVNLYLRRYAPRWGAVFGPNQQYRISDANCVTTVPKDSDVDRVIAIEPQWNMFFQKGIGGLLRRRLRRVGVDLNDQTRNANRALFGSRSRNIATIDLSMASDTVSRWLIHELLPSTWITAMEQCRSPYSVLPSGERILLRKFSSMGNGFTFELESTVFWAICSSVVQLATGQDHGLRDTRVSVYGDDIIVPADCYGPVCKALTWFGFTPNLEKSFADGPFRESCGMHAFDGRVVTPFYIRSAVETLPDLFLLHNNLLRWSAQAFGVRDERVRGLASWLRSHAPEEWRRPRLCDGYGDGAFIGSLDECLPGKAAISQPWRFLGFPRPARQGHEGFDVRILTRLTTSVDERMEGDGRLLRDLWILSRCPETDELKCLEDPYKVPSRLSRSVRASRPDVPLKPTLEFEARYKVRTVRVLWSDLLPWTNIHE